MFPELSVAMHSTVVGPNWNTVADAGEQVTVASTLSVAVGAVNVTLDDAIIPASVVEVISAGQSPITGASISALKKINEIQKIQKSDSSVHPC